MFVCVCNAVTGRDIGSAVAEGCRSLRKLQTQLGVSACCGRCSDHRNAVTLAPRSPNAEILVGPQPATNEALLLAFGILGVAIGAFQWTVNPWFVRAKQAAAEWLLNRDILWPLADSQAWWLLTAYPEANDVFTWLDGIAILGYIGTVTLVLGGTALLAVRGAARLAGADWRRLALGLLWSAWLGLRLLRSTAASNARLGAAFLVWLAPLASVGASWLFVFYV